MKQGSLFWRGGCCHGSLPRVLTNLSMAFCQGQQPCISGHTLSSSLQNCKVAISVFSFLGLFCLRRFCRSIGLFRYLH